MGHRVAPDALVDLLASQHPVGAREQLQDLELPGGQLEACLADVGLIEVGADRDLAERGGGVDRGHLGASVTSHRGLDDADELLGMARLGDPRVGAESQSADALGDRRGTRADDHRQAGQPRTDLLEVPPARGAEDRQIDDERVEPHRHQTVWTERRGQRSVLATERVQALGQHLHESRVTIEDRETQTARCPRARGG